MFDVDNATKNVKEILTFSNYKGIGAVSWWGGNTNKTIIGCYIPQPQAAY